MPVTIVIHSEPSVGPGSMFQLNSDFVGPIPVDYSWRLIITEEGEGIAWTATTIGPIGNSTAGIIGTHDFTWEYLSPGVVFPAEGTPVLVTAQLINSSFTIIDDGSRSDLTWSTQGNFIREIAVEDSFDGSLTAPQASQLAVTAQSVVASLDVGTGTQFVTGVASLIVHPPIGTLVEGEDSVLLTGRGSLTRTFGPFNVAAFGATLTFVTVPAGFGFRDGALPEFYERIIQLATVHELGFGTREVVSEWLDVRVDGTAWMWANALPRRILYDVTPGCSVLLRWLTI